MRRILTVLILLFAFGGTLHASPKFDRALEKKINDWKRGNSGGDNRPAQTDKTVRVIVQTIGDPDVAGVSDHVQKRFGKILYKFNSFNGIVAELSVAALEDTAADAAVSRMSLDDTVAGFDTVDLSSLPSMVDVNRLVTGAAQAWSQYGVDGSGIGVAVLDSGVSGTQDVWTKKDVDFTGTFSTADGYGHGTHVAGIVAGSGGSTHKYPGLAFGSSIINLRVLDQNGNGYTSNVIRAIDWVLQNRNSVGKDGRPLNIRIINLSLGHIPYESAATDPLAIACRKAVMAGIVVVAAAGNYGRDKDGLIVNGGITSPGTEPSVITVGAVTTFNTLTRSDDVVASYSSRGPSIDGQMKPDIGAPGTGIIAPIAFGSQLAKKYPQLIYDSYYMKLSGTSMATPFVSAAVAMILQKNPALKPNAVKAILMYSAEHGNWNPLALGAGYLNTAGAVSLAANINGYANVGSYWLANNGTGLTYSNDIYGYRAVWGGTIVWGDGLYSGNIINYYERAWSSTIVWGDTIVWDSMKLVSGTTIVWETDVEACAAFIQGQTIVWDILDELDIEANTVNISW